ncbi:MAG: rRNA maturation RNase YbeY [Crocinitomicaceae bacterium]|nr:rRNA maturation RNase YbeY [Crocinitomicaceae bacterium]
MSHYGVKSARLEYVFVNDDFLLDMNKAHLQHDYYTDIITFNYNEENSLCGEMYISLDRVIENADKFCGGDFWSELSRVMIHGVLHLVGLNDKSKSEENEMRAAEEFCLSLKSVSRET